ncbi:MAG TPA: DUF1385 domain-containing protein [Solirubrobacterales bacterium]|nr:DUF1385 domain-containing protein [Solirubrobacterales bacterium]
MSSRDEMPAFAGNGAGPQAPPAKVRLGGMALRNGLLVHGPDHWAVALRRADGQLRVESGAKPRFRGKLADLPGLRGIARLGEAFALLPVIKRQVPEVQLPFEDAKVLAAMAASSVVTAGARRLGGRTAASELALAALGLAPTALALRDSQLAAYHGVEHKAIAGYEQDTDAALVAKEHDRCGSNLVAPMIVSTVAGNMLVRSVLGLRGPLAGTAVTLAGVAVSVEMFAWSERNKETALAHAFRKPGYEMQRLFATREPTAEQLEVGRAALAEILRREAP